MMELTFWGVRGSIPANGEAAAYKEAVVKVIGNYARIQVSSDLIAANSEITA